jgi:hypothetical protein
MSEEVTVQPESSASHMPAVTRGGLWLDRIARAFGQTSMPFEMYFPDGAVRRFGQGVPSFWVRLKKRYPSDPITNRLFWWPIGVRKSHEAPSATAIRKASGVKPKLRATAAAIGPITGTGGRMVRNGVTSIEVSSTKATVSPGTHVPVLISRWRV